MKLSFLMKVIPQDLASAFPFAFLAFWSAFLLSAPSFLPSSITLETLLLLVEKISGVKPDHQRAMRSSISILKKKNNICKIKKWLICFFNTWNIFWLLKHTGITEVSALPSLYTEIPELAKRQYTAITNVHSLLSDVLFHINLLTKLFLQKLQTHNLEGSHIHISRSMSWSILHECIHCQLNSVKPKWKATCNTKSWVVGLAFCVPSCWHHQC